MGVYDSYIRHVTGSEKMVLIHKILIFEARISRQARSLNKLTKKEAYLPRSRNSILAWGDSPVITTQTTK